MKFPESRTEILDTVAGIVVNDLKNNDSLSVEATRDIRLSLMFWNDVEDKSLPDIIYGGLDMQLMSDINPARVVASLDFVTGAEEYQGDRHDQLMKELNAIEATIYKGDNYTNVGTSHDITEHCDVVLGSAYTRQAIIESLSHLGYATMDRKITFEFDNMGGSFEKMGLSAQQITEEMKASLELAKLSDSVDMRVQMVYPNAYNDDRKMQVELWHNSKDSVEIQDMVTSMVKEKAKDHNMEDLTMVMTSEYQAPVVPGYKDYTDFNKREKTKKAMEREDSEISFGM